MRKGELTNLAGNWKFSKLQELLAYSKKRLVIQWNACSKSKFTHVSTTTNLVCLRNIWETLVKNL